MHIGLDYANVPDRTWEAIDNYVWLSLIQSTNNRPLDLNGHSLYLFILYFFYYYCIFYSLISSQKILS